MTPCVTPPISEFSDRIEADRSLAAQLPDPSLRAFFLQNLHRSKGGFKWLLNLELIREALPDISGWPTGLQGPSDVPVLWVRGGESGYVRDEHVRPMTRLFPRTHLVTILEGALGELGRPRRTHWGHQEFLTDLRVIIRWTCRTGVGQPTLTPVIVASRSGNRFGPGIAVVA